MEYQIKYEYSVASNSNGVKMSCRDAPSSHAGGVVSIMALRMDLFVYFLT